MNTSLVSTPKHKPTVPILMYHSIAHPIKGAPFKCLHVPPKRFALHMRLLGWLGFTGLSMDKLAPYVRGEKKGRVIGITFDDGYQNNLTHALPILQQHGFSATCYMVSDCIGKHNIWDESKNIPKNPIMTSDEVKQWLAAGMSIGAHTKNHISLTHVNNNIAQDEILGCKADLEKRFDVPVTDFCYPYGHFGSQHIDILEQAGFITATAMARARARVGDNMLSLPRVTVNNNCYPHIFLAKLLTNYEDKKGQKLANKTNINQPISR